MRYQQQQPRQYSNDSSERRPCLTSQYNTYYVGFTSFGASIMNKVETECALLCSVGLFELRGYVVCGVRFAIYCIYVVWICSSPILVEGL